MTKSFLNFRKEEEEERRFNQKLFSKQSGKNLTVKFKTMLS